MASNFIYVHCIITALKRIAFICVSVFRILAWYAYIYHHIIPKTYVHNVTYMCISQQVDGIISDVRRILVSVVYTYAIIQHAAIKVQASDRWITDLKIQAPEFSSHWVRKFLRRAHMRRRKITTDEKNEPSDE